MLDPFGDEPQSVPDHEDARRRRHVPADVDMRRGRSPRLATADRVLEFMDFYSRMHGLDRPGDPSIEPGRGRPGDTHTSENRGDALRLRPADVHLAGVRYR